MPRFLHDVESSGLPCWPASSVTKLTEGNTGVRDLTPEADLKRGCVAVFDWENSRTLQLRVSIQWVAGSSNLAIDF